MSIPNFNEDNFNSDNKQFIAVARAFIGFWKAYSNLTTYQKWVSYRFINEEALQKSPYSVPFLIFMDYKDFIHDKYSSDTLVKKLEDQLNNKKNITIISDEALQSLYLSVSTAYLIDRGFEDILDKMLAIGDFEAIEDGQNDEKIENIKNIFSNL
jgi:hypothetical protein